MRLVVYFSGKNVNGKIPKLLHSPKQQQKDILKRSLIRNPFSIADILIYHSRKSTGVTNNINDIFVLFKCVLFSKLKQLSRFQPCLFSLFTHVLSDCDMSKAQHTLLSRLCPFRLIAGHYEHQIAVLSNLPQIGNPLQGTSCWVSVCQSYFTAVCYSNVAEKSTYLSVCSCAGGKLQHLGLSSGLPNSVALTCCLSSKKIKTCKTNDKQTQRSQNR